jgi:hypothetical protein
MSININFATLDLTPSDQDVKLSKCLNQDPVSLYLIHPPPLAYLTAPRATFFQCKSGHKEVRVKLCL